MFHSVYINLFLDVFVKSLYFVKYPKHASHTVVL